MARYNIYGLGAALVDTEIEVSDADLQALGVEKGMMTLVDEARQHELVRDLEGHLVHSRRASGGSACNSVIAASYFGASTFLSCKVADDDNGSFFMGDLKNAGVTADYTANRGDGITGKCLVMITPDAERSMNTFLGAAAEFSTAELNEEALAESDYVYMEGYLVTSDTGRAAAVRAQEVARASGVKTAISLSDPGIVAHFKEGLQEMIGDGVDLLFCNEAEAKGWADSDDLDTAIAELRRIADTAVVTLGPRGAVIANGDGRVEIAPNKVKAVDTNGAGDMFAGAFLYGVTKGHSLEEAGNLASAAAARVITEFGPRLAPEAHSQVLSEVFWKN